MHALAPANLVPTDPRRPGDLVTIALALPDLAEGDRIVIIASERLTPLLDRSSLPNGRGRLVVHPKAAAKARGFTPQRGTVPDAIRIVFRLEEGSESPEIAYRLVSKDGVVRESVPTTVALVGAPRVDIEVTVDSSDGEIPRLRVRARNDGTVADVLRLIVPIPKPLDMIIPQIPNNVSVKCDERVLAMTITLAAQTKTDVIVSITPNERLHGDIVEIIGMLVSSKSGGTYGLDPLCVVFPPEPVLDATCSIDTADDEIDAGEIVTLRLIIANEGRSWSPPARLALETSAQLTLLPTTMRIDGAAADGELAEKLPPIRPHGTCTVTCKALAQRPIADATACSFWASIDGAVAESAKARIRSSATFPHRRNYIWSSGARVLRPGTIGKASIVIANLGSDRAARVELFIENDGGLMQIKLHDGSEAVALTPNGANGHRYVDLGAFAAGDSRSLNLEFRAKDAFENGQTFPLSARLLIDNEEVDLGSVVYVGASAPRVGVNSTLTILRDEPLRIGDERLLSLVVHNDGSATANDLRVDLELPEALEIIAVQGATVQEGRLELESLPANAMAKISITLRLLTAIAGDATLEIRPTVRGERLKSAQLSPLILRTASQGHLGDPVFDLKQNGSQFAASLTMRNVGDGLIDDAILTLSTTAGYVHESAAINGSPLAEHRPGLSPLGGEVRLPPIAAGGALTLCWRFESGTTRPEISATLHAGGLPELTVAATVRLARRVAKNIDADLTDRPLVLNPDGTVDESLLGSRALPVPEILALGPSFQIDDLPEAPSPAAQAPIEKTVSDDTETTSESTEHATRVATQERASEPQSPAPPPDISLREPPAPNGATTTHAGDTSQARTSASTMTAPEVKPLETPVRSTTLNDGFDDFLEPAAAKVTNDATDQAASAQVEDFIDMIGPVGVARLDTTRSERIRTVLARIDACPNIGWFRHLFVMRLLVPDSIYGIDGESTDSWAAIVDGISRSLSAPLVQTLMPDFTPNLTWMSGLTDATTNSAVELLLKRLPDSIEHPRNYQTEPWQEEEFYVIPSLGLFEYIDPNDRGDLGHLNALLANLMVDRGANVELETALRAYKAEICEQFQTFVYAGMETQLRRIAAGPHPDLDALLASLLELLP